MKAFRSDWAAKHGDVPPKWSDLAEYCGYKLDEGMEMFVGMQVSEGDAQKITRKFRKRRKKQDQ